MKAGDLMSAKNIAHTLKGIAGNLSAREVHPAAAAVESALTSTAEGVEGVDLEDCLATLDQALNRALETIRSTLPQPSEGAPAERTEIGGASELDKTQIVAIARRVKEAAEVGDVTGVMQAVELLPDGSEHRTKFTVLADDFDLDALVQSATELEQACVHRG